jgi:ubiquinone/menaquinone biosynthesis C-methylase UbiE
MNASPRIDTKDVAEAFDAVAGIFDQKFENEITAQIRETVYKTIERIAPAGSSILDINCGTGIDAVNLSGRGYRVVGVDISPQMIQWARKKVRSKNSMRFYVSSFDNLVDEANGSYDIVLSNFGGLNCVRNLEPVARQVAEVSKESSYFVGIVMPPFCLWEFVSGVVHFRWGYAVRRMKKQTLATGFSGNSFAVSYHSPQYIALCFRQWFDVERVIGLNIVSPPPGAERFTKRHPYLTAFLRWLDILVQRMPLIRSMGDHYMIVLKRKSL